MIVISGTWSRTAVTVGVYREVMDKMVFGFPDEQSRNAAGRAAREAGYECRGTGPVASSDPAWLLTVDEAETLRRHAADDLIRRTTPSAGRLR